MSPGSDARSGQLEIPGLLGAVEPLQERWGGDPWRVLVICLLLNRTEGSAVARLLPRFFQRFPDPEALAGAGWRTVSEMLRPLGMYERRGRLLVDLSRAYLADGWEDPSELPGVGEYGADAWRLFVERDPDFEPGDRVLRSAAERMRRRGRC